MHLVELAAPRRILLCTDGLWRAASELRAVFEARTEDELRVILQRCASANSDDATAIVLTLRPA
jgi:hypothetical protein